MPVIIVTMWYPPSKSVEVGSILQKLFENPDPDAAEIGTNPLPLCFGTDEKGISAVSAWQPTEGNYLELRKRIATTMIKFHGVEGLTYKIPEELLNKDY
ncbi:MAG: hypothetical protein KGD58_01545 [Candidatus Lokiarchaeota archaeon]|nr:hypothetical protein [Candidatus Lokiarchaeota archaeon]